MRQMLGRGQASRCLSSIFTRPYPAANNMFSEALALWPLCWEAWMAWGKFCDAMYDKSKEAQWLEFLATCYLQVRLVARSLRLGALDRLDKLAGRENS